MYFYLHRSEQCTGTETSTRHKLWLIAQTKMEWTNKRANEFNKMDIGALSSHWIINLTYLSYWHCHICYIYDGIEFLFASFLSVDKEKKLHRNCLISNRMQQLKVSPTNLWLFKIKAINFPWFRKIVQWNGFHRDRPLLATRLTLSIWLPLVHSMNTSSFICAHLLERMKYKSTNDFDIEGNASN